MKNLRSFKRVESDAQPLNELVAKEEEESTSSESHEKIKDEVVKTIPEMPLWGEMHEGFKIDE